MATTTLLQAPTNASPQIALALSQAAPSYIKSQSSSWSLPYPFSLISNSESQEKWQIHENLFLACLRTGDNDSASALLRELTTRFGEDNERVAALRGLYAEANATTPQDLQNVLEHYGEILKEDPTCFAIRKRRVALLKSMGKIPEAITALTNLLDTSPTDAEGWAELADLYMSQGLLEQAIFSLEEAILLAANAWNLQAKLGEVQWVYAAQKEVGSGDQWRVLSESMRRFCRSVELCDDYLRGYYGLKMTTNRLLELLATTKKSQLTASDPTTGDPPPPPMETIKKLNALATAKLAEIIRRSSSGEKGWDGYSQSEIAAARKLLDGDTPSTQR